MQPLPFMTKFQGYHLMQQSPRGRLFERQALDYLDDHDAERKKV